MAAPNTTRSGVGFRHAQLFALNTSLGVIEPGTASATAYEGVQLSGVKRLTINDPEPKQIAHKGDDRVFALDSLPADEPITGELVTGKINDTVDAMITGTNSFSVGETKMMGLGTDKKGSEVQVAMLAWRQALDTTPGAQQLRRWELRLIPVCLIIPREGSMDENPEERPYSLRPQVVSKHLWGTAFSNSTEGFLEAQVLRGIAQYKPKIVAWKGDGTIVAFNLPTNFPAQATGKMKVWTTTTGGTTTDVTATVTLAVGSVTFSVAPAAGTIITCLYEFA